MSEVASLLDDVAMSLLDANGSTNADLNQIESQLLELACLVEHIDPRCATALQKSAIFMSQFPTREQLSKEDPLLIALKTVAAVQLIVRQESTWEESGIASLLSDDICKTDPLESKHMNSSEFHTGPSSPSPELLKGFVREAQCHLDTIEVELIALETAPANQESLSSIFLAFRSIKGVAGFMGLHSIHAVAHEAENLLVLARDGRKILKGASIDGIFAAADMLKRLIRSLSRRDGSENDPEFRQTLSCLLESLRRIATLDSEVAQAGIVPRHPVETFASLPAQDWGSDLSSSTSRLCGKPKSKRVQRERLDRLVDMIGELVIAEAMVQQDLLTSSHRDASANRSLARLNQVTLKLQELSFALRRVPIRPTFETLEHLARDLSRKLGKPIDFHFVGENTEVDESVLDPMTEPLLRVICNAVHHGIESSQELRVTAGKPAIGNVTLRAFQHNEYVYIEVHDDGQGLDPEHIRKTAQERGILGPDDMLSNRELIQLIFHPRFSTKRNGLDVFGSVSGLVAVRREIDALRGSIELRSESGRGTCVSIRFPLPMAIIDATFECSREPRGRETTRHCLSFYPNQP